MSQKEQKEFKDLAISLDHRGTAEELTHMGWEEYQELLRFFPEGTTPEQMQVYIEHETEANRIYNF